MEQGFIEKHSILFRQLINCTEDTDGENIPVGITRTCEVDDFVDSVMQDWTQQTDRDYTPAVQSLPLAQQHPFLQYRFCTYPEFEQLHHPPKQNHTWDATVFRLLGITDAGEQNKYKKRFPQNREGYFNLMEVMNPQMRTFFFPAL